MLASVLLWIQRIDDLKIKPIKGKDNPADVGTKVVDKRQDSKVYVDGWLYW